MRRVLIIIEEGHTSTARGLAKGNPFNLPEEVANGMFAPTLNASGKGNASHRMAAGLVTDEAFAALEELAATNPWAKLYQYDLRTERSKPRQILATRGLKRIVNTDLPQ
jgi:hypothetical protein